MKPANDATGENTDGNEIGILAILQSPCGGGAWKRNYYAIPRGCGEWRDLIRPGKVRGLSTNNVSAPKRHEQPPSDRGNMAQRGSKVTEKISGFQETLKQDKKVNDVATANFLVEQIGAKRHIGDMLRTACRELRSRFPHRDDPENQWTEKRLKAWRYNESQTVKHFQMVELFETAEALRAARNEHAEYIAKTARIRRMAELVASNEAGGMAER